MRPGGRDKLLGIIARSAYSNDRAYEGCTRPVLASLVYHFKEIYQTTRCFEIQKKY